VIAWVYLIMLDTRMIFLPRLFLFLALTIVAAGPAWSQEAPVSQTDTTTLHVASRLVVLDVVVLDRNGKFVSNLDRSQFTVTEDKVPQTIRNFDPPTGHEMPPGSAGKMVVQSSADLPKIGNAPVNVLVFDEVNTPFMQLAYARQMMERYLKRMPEVLPVPTLFLAASSKKLAVLHDYTQSRADLLESIRTHTTDTDFTMLTNTLNGGSSGSDNGLVKTLGALTQIASSVHGVPGRKNVIWVGTGYRNATDLNDLSNVDNDKVKAAIQTVTGRMQAAHVTLYLIDPAGVTPRDPGTPDTLDGGIPGSAATGYGAYDPSLGFESLVYTTGGRILPGRNDIDAEIEQTAVEGTRYYTLAYVPTSANDAARPYRKIRVKVSDPSLRVITRDGYFGGEEKVDTVASNAVKKQPKQLLFDLTAAARTTLVYNGLHIEPVPTKNGYLLKVKAADLTWEPQPDGSRRAEVTVVAVGYNNRDKEVGQHAAELKEELGASDVIGPQSQVGFAFPFAVPVGSSRVRIVMRDAGTGTMGSVNTKP
jgi:VWFA-related protein